MALFDAYLGALIYAAHRINQSKLPIIIIGAGLPTILRITGEAKSYAERLFKFIEIISLKDNAAIDALIEPARTKNVNFSGEAIKLILHETKGYPYFIQMFGSCIWHNLKSKTIDLKCAKESYDDYISELDTSFYAARYSRATAKEKEFMLAMAFINETRCEVSKVAERMGKKTNGVSTFRNNLINNGLIFSISHGLVDFTVPNFHLYLRRIQGL